MSWSAPLLALLGTIVGASVTLVADRVRWRRDQGERRQETLRIAYGTYLAALHATSEEIRAVSLGEHPVETSRQSAVRAAFRSAKLNACREQLVLLAPEPVVRAGDATFTALRDLRDAVVAAATWTRLEAVSRALGDPAWRVREMAAKVVARHLVGDLLTAVAELRADPVPRVRAAATRAVAVLTHAGA